MKKVFLSFLPFLFIYTTAADVKNYKVVECKLKATVRKTRDRKNTGHPKHTHPHLPYKEGTSTNWSGYIAATNLTNPTLKSVKSVFGSWTVPSVSASAHNTYCAIWIGIDGYTNGSVEQIGTSHEWVQGRQVDSAWFEMYPNFSYEITGFPLKKGDLIGASVVYLGNNTFQLSLFNHTRKVQTTVPTTRTKASYAQRNSAEWIVEAPYLDGILPLSHFGNVTFSNCLANIDGTLGPIVNKKWKDTTLTMVTNTGIDKATVSKLSANGKGFEVSWRHE